MEIRSWRFKGLMRLALVGVGVLLAANLFAATPGGKKEPAAVISNLSGEVYLLQEGTTKKKRAELASFLFAGDKLDLGSNGTVTLVYFQGCREETLKGKGAALILADKTKGLGKTVVASIPLKKCGPPPKVEITTESSLAKGVLTLRGQNMITRLSPSETKVLTQSPAFSWSSPESKKFTVALYDKNLVKLWQVETEKQEISYPAKASPLKWGEMYRWSVNNDVYAYFAVATEEEIKHLKEKAGSYEIIGGQAHRSTSFFLLVALMYEEAGFNLEAANGYQRVLQLAPQSRQVHIRLAKIYDQMGWRAEAQKELEEAKKLYERE